MVRQRQADLLLIAATVIAACGWIFSREAIAGMPVFAFLGLRFFFAALLLLPFCRGFRPQKQHWLAASQRRRHPVAAVLRFQPVSP